MKRAPARPDTEKQQRLAWALTKAGHPEGWRDWLNALRDQGRSGQQIAYLIRDVSGIGLDQSTVNLWIKQAERAKTPPHPDTAK